MTREQANKALYVVAFFAFLTAVSMIGTAPYLWKLLLMNPIMLLLSLIGLLFVFLLIIAPFFQQNIFLFGVIVVSLIGSSFYHSIIALFDYLLGNTILATVGVIPGLFTNISYFFMDSTGLAVLALRIYGYIKEHRQGLDTKF